VNLEEPWGSLGLSVIQQTDIILFPVADLTAPHTPLNRLLEHDKLASLCLAPWAEPSSFMVTQ
jgi:hypothetical protein